MVDKVESVDVERVAEALCADVLRQFQFETDGYYSRDEHADSVFVDGELDFLALARAAIAALQPKEPEHGE